MSKYIIDIPDNVKKIVYFHLGNTNAVWTTSNDLDDLGQLNSDYINEHFGDLQDDAYNKGYAQCQDDYGDALKHAKDTAYQKGFEDGKWKSEDGCTGCKYKGKTGEHLPCDYCMNNFKNQWTSKSDKIEVGDTVNLKDGSRDNDGIVTKSWDNDRHFIMWADGSGGVWDKEYIVKTGRHFDIASILEDMRND